MRWPQRWMRQARRWAAAGAACTALAAFGCRTTESAPAPHPLSGLLPRLFPADDPQPPTFEKYDALVRHAHAIADESSSPASISLAGASLNAPEPATSDAVGPPQPGMAPDAVPLPPAKTEETLDLGVALRLAGVDNPTIALAQEQIREAMAGQLAARSLLLPSVNIGGNYHWHDGALQPSFGGMRIVKSQSLYLGFGARTLAAETLAFPGIRLFAHLGDAIYEPLAARQQVVVRSSSAQAVQNNMLGRVATAYMELIGAEARIALLKKSEQEVGEVVRLTRVYADKGQGREGDADRAQTHLELLRREIHEAEGEAKVASARLCRLLNLDPSIHLRTPGGAVVAFRLIPEDSQTRIAGCRGDQQSAGIVRADRGDPAGSGPHSPGEDSPLLAAHFHRLQRRLLRRWQQPRVVAIRAARCAHRPRRLGHLDDAEHDGRQSRRSAAPMP